MIFGHTHIVIREESFRVLFNPWSGTDTWRGPIFLEIRICLLPREQKVKSNLCRPYCFEVRWKVNKPKFQLFTRQSKIERKLLHFLPNRERQISQQKDESCFTFSLIKRRNLAQKCLVAGDIFIFLTDLNISRNFYRAHNR